MHNESIIFDTTTLSHLLTLPLLPPERYRMTKRTTIKRSGPERPDLLFFMIYAATAPELTKPRSSFPYFWKYSGVRSEVMAFNASASFGFALTRSSSCLLLKRMYGLIFSSRAMVLRHLRIFS